jgi:hypothetical protein
MRACESICDVMLVGKSPKNFVDFGWRAWS